MEKENLLFFRSWFFDYVKKFYSDDFNVQRNIKLKEEHTLRVCENIILIGKSINLDETKLFIAESVALFHDIGRFKQFKKYATFDDRKSENHAALGVKILEDSGVLSCLPTSEQELILKSVEFHNLQKIPAKLKPDILLFSKLLRDADKLDIFGVITEYYAEKDKNPNPALELELSDAPTYSHEFIEDILNYRVSKNNLNTHNDMKLFQLTWLFDINFQVTFKCFKDKNYLEKIIKALPDDETIRGVHEHLKDYLDLKKHLKNKN